MNHTKHPSTPFATKSMLPACILNGKFLILFWQKACLGNIKCIRTWVQFLIFSGSFWYWQVFTNVWKLSATYFCFSIGVFSHFGLQHHDHPSRCENSIHTFLKEVIKVQQTLELKEDSLTLCTYKPRKTSLSR